MTDPEPCDRRHSERRKADKLACPTCGSLQSFVVARHMTLKEQLTDGYWRHRRCSACGCRFATVETVVASAPSESFT